MRASIDIKHGAARRGFIDHLITSCRARHMSFWNFCLAIQNMRSIPAVSRWVGLGPLLPIDVLYFLNLENLEMMGRKESSGQSLDRQSSLNYSDVYLA